MLAYVAFCGRSNMKPKKEPRPKLDTARIDDTVLALLYLNQYHCGVAWKGFDWDAMGVNPK